MINFKNQEEVLEYFKNNTKHYTPKGVVGIISKQIEGVNFDGLKILETSVGEGNLLVDLIEKNETMKKASYYIYDIEEYNVKIAKARLINIGCDANKIHTFVGDFLSFDIAEKFDYCFQNPPYGQNIQTKPTKTLQNNLGIKNEVLKKPEAAFLHQAINLADRSFNLLPVGVLFRSGWENKVIKNNFKKLKNITLLSPKQFTMTRIPVIIVETSNHNDHLQLVDATDFSKKEGKIMTMTDEHVKETCKRINGEIVDHLTHKLDEQEAKENNYNLNITRYIQREIEEEIDIEQLAIEIDENITEILNFFSDNDRHENVNIFKKNAKEMKNIFG